MKKSKISFISAILATAMLSGSLIACTPAVQNDESSTDDTATQTEITTEKDVESNTEVNTGDETVTETPEVIIEGQYADTIMTANKLADGVQAYYDAARKKYTVVNKNMTLEYPLTPSVDQMVSSIKNTKGNSYIENTMDVFVKMKDGNTYYASKSTASARANIYKIGYYYYDVHLLEQNFLGGAEITAEKAFIARAVTGKHDVSAFKINDDVITYTVSGSDPYVYTANSKSNEKYCFSAEEFNAVQFTMKTTKSSKGELYFIAGNRTGHSADQRVNLSLEPDGEWHTYTVMLAGVPDYTGAVTSLRFDVGASDETIELKDIKAVNIVSGAPNIVVDRNFHTYSDKMNQVLHFVAKEATEGIEAFGIVTEIAADTVSKVIVKDAKGLHDTIEGVDWDTAEYVGFDIKDAGVFGYILLQHETTGKMTVALEDGNYVITQTSAPKDGKMIPPNAKVTYTKNDFYMGHRVYTDENHTFDAFLTEAEYERNPLQTISGDSYAGYDALRGAYKFTVGGSGFNEPFFTFWNRHYDAEITVEGADIDRNIYIYSFYSGGCGEGAALLSENDLMLPVPVMIYKNFGGEDEEPIFNAGDDDYSEAYFPLVVKAGEKTTVKILNLYMNWGAFPLKQLSSIQYFWPYYHLSIGTTETSCISPWYGARDLWTLPDFRSMSMPYWFELEGSAYSNQPQHTHGGYQYFLQYTDADGNYSATENINNNIDSAGPVYAEATMDYISDDGRIKVSYTHLEYAQTDELRAYYEIEYEVLEDITIKDFKNDFSFYSFEGYAGYYRKMGYLDENNQIVHKATNGTDTAEILKLGDKSPYVALYDLYSTSERWATNNVNLGFVIYDSDFTIGGKACDESFVIVGEKYVYSLSLDLEEVTLKAGDKMKINMIICPWGWYNSTDDKNMQDVRANTCLDPLKVEVTDGKKIESPFMPRIKSSNGKSAEFTLSGASNNVAVRVYGFNKLTAPKIYEKVDGKWVEYVVSSINNPDKLDIKHHYDGYNVYYDGDGTYSYAFTVNMDDIDSRTFKVVAEEDFKGWGDIEENVNQDPLNVYVDPVELDSAAKSNTGIGKTVVSADKSYVSFYGNGTNAEGFFNAYTALDTTVTGQYLVIKYRIPTTISENVQFQIFTSTVNGGAAAADNFYLPAPVKDGEWHIVIADMSKQGLPTFKANEAGKFIVKYLRYDIFNGSMSKESYVDIAYVGISDDLADICKLNNNKGTADYCEFANVKDTLDLATGKFSSSGESGGEVETPNPEVFIDPASGWKESGLKYRSAIDFINGKGDGSGAYDQRGGTSDRGIDILTFNGPTADNAYLAIAGWTVIDKGVSKYMWSADDGKTWNECVLFGRDSFATVNAGNGIIAVANNMFGYDYLEYQANSIYQGSEGSASGISAHLTDFIGKTVNVIFAAVPETETDSLCLIAYIKNVRVYASDAEAEEGEKKPAINCTHLKAESFKYIDDGDDSTDSATIATVCACGEKQFGVDEPKYVFYFQNVKGNKDSGNVYSSCENSKGYRKLDAAEKGLTLDANGCFTINGWGGVDGGCSKLVIRVYSSDGTELTNGWIDWTSGESKHAEAAVEAEMAKRGIDTAVATRFNNIVLNLSSYAKDGATITVKIAMVADGAPEDCNDKYVYLCEMTGIKAMQ